MNESEPALQIATAFERGRSAQGIIGYYPTTLEALRIGLATGELPPTGEDDFTFMLTDHRYPQIDNDAFEKARESAISKSAAESGIDGSMEQSERHPRGLIVLVSMSLFPRNNSISIDPFKNPGEWTTVKIKGLPIKFVAGIEPVGQEETDFLFQLQDSVDRPFADS